MRNCISAISVLGLSFILSSTLTHAQDVRADTGGVAIGRDVVQSTIIVGISPEQLAALIRQTDDLSESQKKMIATLEGQLDLNQRQIRAALDILGENNVPPERLAAKLVEIARRFKDLQASTSTRPGDDPKVAALKADAKMAINTGELTKADTLLAAVETEQRRDLDRLAVDVADTSAWRGQIALTQLRYNDAARHFADAARIFPQGSAYEDKRIGYLRYEANALERQGDEFGDTNALRLAIERHKKLLDLSSRERVPFDWAATQNNLGSALLMLGDREGGAAHLEALAAFREALTELSRERAPIIVWMMIQNNLGNALFALGKRETGKARLEEAVVAFREALTEQTRSVAPSFWAGAQSNLGNALVALGERETGIARLQEGVGAFREALKEISRERAPLQWAMTQSNLGSALWQLGGRESDTSRLEEAVVAYREALKERRRERFPLLWANTQNSLGNALRDIGELESGTMRLDEAILVYDEALKEFTRERVLLQWAMTTGNQGVALRLVAERRGDIAIAERATTQIKQAFEIFGAARNIPFASFYQRQLLDGQGLVERLRKR